MAFTAYDNSSDPLDHTENGIHSLVSNSRQLIDEIDWQIIGLLNQRASIALEIGIQKQSVGSGSLSAERESEIMKKIFDLPEGPMPRLAISHIFSEIISACRDLQQPISVAFLGPETTFSHAVTLKRFGHSVELKPVASIADVFQEVENGRASFGVAPVENSIEGGVSATMDSFVNSSLTISGEIYASIRHTLMSSETSLSSISKIYSHPQALNQCRKWLNNNLPGVTLVDSSSTAEAARKASKESSTAAIASSLAAREFNLNVLAENVQDRSDNKTRFVIIGTTNCKPTGIDKTSIYFTSKHQSGSLCKALSHFSRRAINLTRIESRPLKERPWEYSFFVDCEGHQAEPLLTECLHELSGEVEHIKILGSYPRMDPSHVI